MSLLWGQWQINYKCLLIEVNAGNTDLTIILLGILKAIKTDAEKADKKKKKRIGDKGMEGNIRISLFIKRITETVFLK